MRDSIRVFEPRKVASNVMRYLKIPIGSEVLDRRAVVISIAGPFRQGRSFHMNFILERELRLQAWFRRDLITY